MKHPGRKFLHLAAGAAAPSAFSGMARAPRAVGEIARLAYSHSVSKGANADNLLRKAGLSHEQIDDPDALLEVRSQIRFLNLVAEALNDELLGFHLAQKFDLRTVGLLHYVLASSDTLDEAIKRAARYSSIVNEGIRLAYLERKEFGISIEYIGVSRHLDRHQIEFWMAALMIGCRQLTNRSLTAESVSFIHTGARKSELQSFYGCELQFDGKRPADLAFLGPFAREMMCSLTGNLRGTHDEGYRSSRS